MPNLRIISDNAADRLVDKVSFATPAVAALPASNLLQDSKFNVCRSTGLALTINAAWASLENIRAVVLPSTNFSPTATMRVRLTNEPATTNMLRYSEQADNSAYTKTGCTIIPDTIVAPDGTMTADKIVEDTSAAGHSILQSVAVAANTWYAWSRFYKAGERTFAFASVGNFSAQATTASVYLNLLTGAVSGTGSTRATVTAYPNGWWRLTITVQTGATAASISPGSYISATGATQNYTGDGVSGIYVWGGQFEAIASSNLPATSYYPTSASAATRPVGYIDNWQTYLYDSGLKLCCPAPATKLRGWTAYDAASAYGYGGGTCATVWLGAVKSVYGARIDIVDNANLQGYVEAGRLIIGDYWEPVFGADSGASISVVDTSKHTRTEAGSMVTEVGPRYRKQSLSMPYLNETDRQALWGILMGGGIANPVFISLYPENTNTALEKTHAMYGKLVTTPVMTTPYFSIANATLEIEEI